MQGRAAPCQQSDDWVGGVMYTQSLSSERTIFLLALLVAVSIPAVLVSTILISSLVSGGWSIALAILVFLVATGTALHIFQGLRRRRQVADLSPIFPGFNGQLLPLFDLLVVRDAGGEARPGEHERHLYWLGESEADWVLMRSRQIDDPKELSAASVIHRAGRPVVFGRGSLQVSVIERSDEEMAAAFDNGPDYVDRLVEAAVTRAMGVRIKKKLVPYAAYIHLSDGQLELLAAVPSEIKDGMLAAAGAGIVAQDESGQWIVDKAGEGIASAAKAGLHEGAERLVGANVMDVADQAADWAGEALWLLNPGGPVKGSTEGARGRATAQLIAARLRAAA